MNSVWQGRDGGVVKIVKLFCGDSPDRNIFLSRKLNNLSTFLRLCYILMGEGFVWQKFAGTSTNGCALGLSLASQTMKREARGDLIVAFLSFDE